MAYADYGFYIEVYLNGAKKSAMPEDSFLKYSQAASDYLDMLTFGRTERLFQSAMGAADGSSLQVKWVKIKKAACAVAEILYNEEVRHGGIASESTDGESYSYLASNTKSLDEKKYTAAACYLLNTGLLCRRGNCG